VRQVGHLQELYRDARSTEHKIVYFCIVNKTFRLVNVDFYIVNTRVDPLVLTFMLVINARRRKSNTV
jgi:hypothetical protein